MRTEDVFIPIDRDRPMPLYIQIKEGILRILDALPQDREFLLPAQRDLARQLGVSRNTVTMAYAELEREGRVTSRVGRGTTAVNPAEKLEGQTRLERLTQLVEHCMEQALALGFTVDQYAETVQRHVREKRKVLRQIKLAFVECNREQLGYFTEHLDLDAGGIIIPFLLTDIREKPGDLLPKLRSADIVVTSFYHVDEMKRLLADDGPPLVAVDLQPEIATVVRIARIPESASVGLLAFSRQFVSEIDGTLSRMHIESSRIRRFFDRDPRKLREFAASVDVIIVSPPRRQEVEAVAKGKEVIEFLFAPDKGSVNSLRVALLELKERRKADSEGIPPDDAVRP